MTAQEYVKSFDKVAGISNEDFFNNLPNGTAKVTKFTGSNAEIPDSWEVGDTFQIPESYDVISQVIAGSTRPYEYIRVPVTHMDGSVTYGHIGKSTFNRRLVEVDEDGKRTGKRYATVGEPVNDFCKHMSVDDSFKALAGKVIRVKSVTPIRTRSFRSDAKYTDSRVLELEYVA
jgi:hypothetical protein